MFGELEKVPRLPGIRHGHQERDDRGRNPLPKHSWTEALTLTEAILDMTRHLRTNSCPRREFAQGTKDFVALGLKCQAGV